MTARRDTALGQSGDPAHMRESSGAERSRTADLLNAIQALSQLSYSPNVCVRAIG